MTSITQEVHRDAGAGAGTCTSAAPISALTSSHQSWTRTRYHTAVADPLDVTALAGRHACIRFVLGHAFESLRHCLAGHLHQAVDRIGSASTLSSSYGCAAVRDMFGAAHARLRYGCSVLGGRGPTGQQQRDVASRCGHHQVSSWKSERAVSRQRHAMPRCTRARGSRLGQVLDVHDRQAVRHLSMETQHLQCNTAKSVLSPCCLDDQLVRRMSAK